LIIIRGVGAGGRDARHQPNAEINAMIEATAAPMPHGKRQNEVAALNLEGDASEDMYRHFAEFVIFHQVFDFNYRCHTSPKIPALVHGLRPAAERSDPHPWRVLLPVTHETYLRNPV